MKRLDTLQACRRWFLAGLPVLLLIAGCTGCDGDAQKNLDDTSNSPMDDQWREDFYASIMASLRQTEKFHSGATIREQIVARLTRQDQPPGAPPDSEEDVLMAACPEPEMLRQIVDRLNQWAELPKSVPDWQVDPMLADLSPSLVKSPLTEGLGELKFVPFDGFALQEVVWLHDASIWARGNRRDPIEQARHLFDWTVRNIQLEHSTGDSIPRFPWETLLHGRGTPLERAWVFILLARQRGIDAAVLALEELPPQSSPDETPAEPQSLQPWVVAVLRGDSLYLFEPMLGLPIPAPNGLKLGDSGELGASGELIVEPATLKQVLQDETLLDRLSPDKADPYPLKLSGLKKQRIVALLEGSPSYLTRRMKLVQMHPKQPLVLTASPQAQAKRLLGASPLLADARLWPFPFETIRERSQLSPPRTGAHLRELLKFYADSSATLRTGRMLHIKGKLLEAVNQYLQSFRSDDELDDMRQRSSTEAVAAFRRRYPNAKEDRIRQYVRSLVRSEQVLLRQARRNAAYWLGTIAQQRGDYDAAIDYFAERTLEAEPDGPWTHGATYNLARCYEASGQYDKAIELYRRDATSPGHAGNLLRARWIESLLSATETEALPAAETEALPAAEDGAEPSPATKVPAGSS